MRRFVFGVRKKPENEDGMKSMILPSLTISTDCFLLLDCPNRLFQSTLSNNVDNWIEVIEEVKDLLRHHHPSKICFDIYINYNNLGNYIP